jgi:fibronectin-binding autotransporter adhesin
MLGVSVLAATLSVTGAAHATVRHGAQSNVSCTTSWANAASGDWNTAANWTNGVPTSTCAASITVPGSYTVFVTGESVQAQSLTLGASSGQQALSVDATDSCGGASNAEVSLASGGTVNATGIIALTQAGGCSGGTPLLEISGGTLSNAGTIETVKGANESGSADLDGAFTNTGTISINAPTAFGANLTSSSLDNHGTLSLGSGFTLSASNNASVTDDTGGAITTGGGTGLLSMSGGTYTQGAGTTSPATLDPANPAVILNSTTLAYTGTGASSLIARGTFGLSGNLASAQNLTVQATDMCGGATNGQANVTSSLTNAGTIQLTQAGGCTGGTPFLEVRSPAVLTNSGTIRTDKGTNQSASAQLDGAFTNTGTIAINAPTAFGGNLTSSSLDNKGALTLATGETLTTSNGASVTDDTAGSISNGTGTGDLVMNGGTYTQGAGTISQTDPVPANPAVILNSTTLKYTGKGKGTIVARGSFSETGNLAKGQDLALQGTDFCGGATNADMTPTKKLTNAAVVTFAHAGGCSGASVFITLGTGIKLTNTGTLSGASPQPEQISGALTNTGTVSVAAGDKLELTGTLSNMSAAGVLKGGIYTLSGTFQYANSTFNTSGITNNGATITLNGSGAFTDGNSANALRNLATNAKKLTLSGGESLSSAASLTNTGAISLGGGSTLSVGGSYTQSGAKSSLTTTLASATSYGQIVATGASSLTGTLTIDQTYDASASTSEAILGSSARTGTFTKVTVKNTGGKGSATPAASYTPTGVTVTG